MKDATLNVVLVTSSASTTPALDNTEETRIAVGAEKFRNSASRTPNTRISASMSTRVSSEARGAEIRKGWMSVQVKGLRIKILIVISEAGEQSDARNAPLRLGYPVIGDCRGVGCFAGTCPLYSFIERYGFGRG